MEAQGEVRRPLHGPKGEIRGALLKDGTSLRLAPHAAAEFVDYLGGCAYPCVRTGVKTKHGKTIAFTTSRIAWMLPDLEDSPRAGANHAKTRVSRPWGAGGYFAYDRSR